MWKKIICSNDFVLSVIPIATEKRKGVESSFSPIPKTSDWILDFLASELLVQK